MPHVAAIYERVEIYEIRTSLRKSASRLKN